MDCFFHSSLPARVPAAMNYVRLHSSLFFINISVDTYLRSASAVLPLSFRCVSFQFDRNPHLPQNTSVPFYPLTGTDARNTITEIPAPGFRFKASLAVHTVILIDMPCA